MLISQLIRLSYRVQRIPKEEQSVHVYSVGRYLGRDSSSHGFPSDEHSIRLVHAVLCGFVIIAESHISIHTFPDRNSALVDIFSCKQFDIHKAVDYIVAKLDAHKADKKLSGRGKEYPRQVEAAREIVIRSRPSLKQ